MSVFYTLDLALDGLFLESGPIDLRCNDPVTLEVEARLPDFPMSRRIVHRSDDGIGMVPQQINKAMQGR